MQSDSTPTDRDLSFYQRLKASQRPSSFRPLGLVGFVVPIF